MASDVLVKPEPGTAAVTGRGSGNGKQRAAGESAAPLSPGAPEDGSYDLSAIRVRMSGVRMMVGEAAAIEKLQQELRQETDQRLAEKKRADNAELERDSEKRQRVRCVGDLDPDEATAKELLAMADLVKQCSGGFAALKSELKRRDRLATAWYREMVARHMLSPTSICVAHFDDQGTKTRALVKVCGDPGDREDERYHPGEILTYSLARDPKSHQHLALRFRPYNNDIFEVTQRRVSDVLINEIFTPNNLFNLRNIAVRHQAFPDTTSLKQYAKSLYEDCRRELRTKWCEIDNQLCYAWFKIVENIDLHAAASASTAASIAVAAAASAAASAAAASPSTAAASASTGAA